MSNETKNEPKSLAEMSREELLQAYDDLDWQPLNAVKKRYEEIRAEIFLRMEPGGTSERKLQEQAEAVLELLETLEGSPAHSRRRNEMTTCNYLIGSRCFPIYCELPEGHDGKHDPKSHEDLAAPLEPTCPMCGKPAIMPAEPHTLTREDIEKLWTAVSKLESQVCRNPDLPEVYKSIVSDAFAVLRSLSPSTRPSGDGWTTCEEETAIGKLMESQGLSRTAVLRQALRTYQLVATGHAQLVTEIWGKKKEPAPSHENSLRLRCLATHAEGGQCELARDHEFPKHLAGMILWPVAPPTEEKGPSQK